VLLSTNQTRARASIRGIRLLKFEILSHKNSLISWSQRQPRNLSKMKLVIVSCLMGAALAADVARTPPMGFK